MWSLRVTSNNRFERSRAVASSVSQGGVDDRDKAASINAGAPARRSTSSLEPLIKLLSWIGIAALAIATLVVGSCTFKVHNYNSAFKRVNIGDSEDSAVARLGIPSYRERALDPYLRYTSTPCVAPCVSRLWWEWPIMPGIEAWSIEVDQNRTVLKTYRWESP
jgi:hypothetical protein